MKVVVADESRADARDLYVPMPKGAIFPLIRCT